MSFSSSLDTIGFVPHPLKSSSFVALFWSRMEIEGCSVGQQKMAFLWISILSHSCVLSWSLYSGLGLLFFGIDLTWNEIQLERIVDSAHPWEWHRYNLLLGQQESKFGRLKLSFFDVWFLKDSLFLRENEVSPYMCFLSEGNVGTSSPRRTPGSSILPGYPTRSPASLAGSMFSSLTWGGSLRFGEPGLMWWLCSRDRSGPDTQARWW